MGYQHDHIHLTTENVDEWTRYYVEVFDAKVTSCVESGGNKIVNLNVGGAPLRISSLTGVERHLTDQTGKAVRPAEGYHHLGFLVDDVDACVRDLVSRGAKLETPVKQASPTLRCAFLQLPGDVRIELCQQVR